jgi:serine/threonine protein phosphatase PrpC
MARRPLFLCAVTVASTAVWVAASDAGAQPQPQPPVVIALADEQTTCAPTALAAVTKALQDVEDVDAARRDVVIAVAWPAAEGLQDAADGFAVSQYRWLLRVPAAEAWFVQPPVYDCPEGTETSQGEEAAFSRLAAEGRWPTVNVTSADQLQSLAWERFGKPPSGGNGLLVVVLVVLALAVVAAVVIALVVRARRRAVPSPVAPPGPPPPPPPGQVQVPPPPPQTLGVSRQQSPAARQGPAALPAKGQSRNATGPFALRPMTTLDGVVGSKLQNDLASVEPGRKGTAAVWQISRSGLQCTAVYTEKVPELGEDAEPSIVVVPEHRAILLGVYDGLGGAGSRAVETSGGLTYNEAFVASRVAREEVESWFLGGGSAQLLDEHELHARLDERLSSVAATHLPVRSSGVRSNLARTLPTTLALAALRETNGELAIEALWAGDSRVFLLTPQAGLQQLTADHVRNADVLQQLVNDSPMSNMVSASNKFEIATSRVEHRGPGVVLCATDGVFGYVRTPGEVECVLLQTLQAASDPSSWGDHLVHRITAYTGDDATLAVAAVGYRDFAALRSAFADRAASVDAEQHLPFANVDATDHDSVASIREKTWGTYQTAYTALMPGGEHVKARSR